MRRPDGPDAERAQEAADFLRLFMTEQKEAGRRRAMRDEAILFLRDHCDSRYGQLVPPDSPESLLELTVKAIAFGRYGQRMREADKTSAGEQTARRFDKLELDADDDAKEDAPGEGATENEP